MSPQTFLIQNSAVPSPSTYAMVSLITAFFMPFLAVIFGHLAKNEIRRSQGAKTGDGIATAGLILGYLGVLVFVCWLWIGLMSQNHTPS